MLYLYSIFIKPIELIVEFVFVVLYRLFWNSGYAIIGVSLVINTLVLPIYRQADRAQEEERKKQEEMRPKIELIKRAFSGDERYMILSTYYKKVGYHPFSALRGVLPILLQIPFFIAAYHFLSNLEVLNGASFFILKDLGAPDGLLSFGTLRINLLPILMTTINIISAVIYLRGFPLKSKLQTYGLALAFLVLLYGSPSGLVFYWTLNNIFSLGKNIVMKLLPAASKRSAEKEAAAGKKEEQPGLKSILPAQLCLILLMGAVIPAALVASSPGDYIMMRHFMHPIHYVINTLCISFGYFGVWMTVFFCLFGSRAKRFMGWLTAVASFVCVTDHMFFAKNQGLISADFLYSKGRLYFEPSEKILNLAVILVLAGIVSFIWFWKNGWARRLLAVLAITLAAFSLKDCISIMNKVSAMDMSFREDRDPDAPIFRLSTTGRNVMVICLDSAMGLYVPYIMNEKPELKTALDGFVFYPNTISFGQFTSKGSQGIWGGYEYVPSISDLDTEKTQEQKRYEADTMLPRLFASEGFEVTACDIPFSGYQDVPNPAVFDEIEGVHGLNTMGYYTSGVEAYEANRQRAFFFYSVMKCMPVAGQAAVYDAGRYFSSQGLLKLSGGQSHYFDSIGVLEHLPVLTEITDEDTDTLLMLHNDTSHEPIRLRVPEYDRDVDLLDLSGEELVQTREDAEGRCITLDNDACYYYSNMAAYLRMADYFAYMKENGVYDNTRIILVADHGRPTKEFPEMDIDNPYGADDCDNLMRLQPILMVKDFDAHGEFESDMSFMTNADVPTLAAEGLIADPVNPYTGKKINNDEKYAHDQVILFPGTLTLTDPKDKVFGGEDAHWITVHDDIFDLSNWKWTDDYLSVLR